MLTLRLTPSAPGSSLLTLSSRIRPSRRAGVEASTMTLDNWAWRSASSALLRGRSMVLSWTSIWSSVVRAFSTKSKKDRAIEMFFLLLSRRTMKFSHSWSTVCSLCLTPSASKFVRRRSWSAFRTSRRTFSWTCCKNRDIIPLNIFILQAI